MTRIRTLLAVCRARARRPGGDRRLRRRRRQRRGPAGRSSTRPSTTTPGSTSGDLSLTASVDRRGRAGRQLRGEPQRAVPGRRRRPGRDPAARLDGAASRRAAPARAIDFAGGLTVTEDNAYVEYNDQAYEVGTDTFAQIKERSRGAGRRRRRQPTPAARSRSRLRAGDRAGRAATPRRVTSTSRAGSRTSPTRAPRSRRHRGDPHLRRRSTSTDAHRHRQPRRVGPAAPPRRASTRRSSSARLERGHRRVDRRLLGDEDDTSCASSTST